MKTLTVVNDDGVERKIGEGALSRYENAGFRVKGKKLKTDDKNDDDGKKPASSAGSKAAKSDDPKADGKDSTPEGDAAP